MAADANPTTGAAVYDSVPEKGLGLPTGWQQLGGTSEAAPIIAAVYALANGKAPKAGTYPVHYLYQHTSGLFDVTSGSDGTCPASKASCARPGLGTTGRPAGARPAAWPHSPRPSQAEPRPGPGAKTAPSPGPRCRGGQVAEPRVAAGRHQVVVEDAGDVVSRPSRSGLSRSR